jgi:hypothetical protein
MPMFAKLFVRDLVIVGLTALLWHFAAAASADAGFRGDAAGVLAGVMIGVSGYLLHEWGHLLGGLVAGSTVRPGRGLASGFLFSFDSTANTRRQFIALSLGGWISTAIVLWGVYTLLPDGLFAARVARGVVAANVLLILLLEVPLVLYALVTGNVPPVENQPSATPAVAAAAE